MYFIDEIEHFNIKIVHFIEKSAFRRKKHNKNGF